MKIVGVLGRDLRIVDGVTEDKIPQLKDKFDFLWLDIERLDSKEYKIAQEVFGFQAPEEGSYPIAITSEFYDTVVLNYYDNLYRRDFIVYYSKSFLITVHQGPSSAVEEAMASLNEMLVMGNLNSETILYQLVY
ncbi:MAG: hypothetical protein JXB14_07145, partial [Candidatus Altiarchaeota archaeon]|nr:hypothetical protein [Candidatus Altiarchaeota archaeon]